MPRHDYEQEHEHEHDGLRREPAPFNRDPSGSARSEACTSHALPDGSRLIRRGLRSRRVLPAPWKGLGPTLNQPFLLLDLTPSVEIRFPAS